MFAVLLVGCGVLMASFLSYGMATSLMINVVVRLIHNGYTEGGFFRHMAVMMIVTVITAASHLLPIALWAVTLLACGQTAGFEDAFYLSAENYTALGYGDILLSGPWRLLGPLEAINGLLFFGLSTALMFAVMSRLVASRLHFHLGEQGEPT
jgi:Ion channel